MAWEVSFVRTHVISLVSAIFLFGCAQPPVTGDIVIGQASHYTSEHYKETLQWEKEHPEQSSTTYIEEALDAGIPRQAIQDGRVLRVSCEKMGTFGPSAASYYLLLPNGVKTHDRLVVEFEAVTSPRNRATRSYSYQLSRFIRVSDVDYYDVPGGCLWYHNGRLIEGRDRIHEESHVSFSWSEIFRPR